MAVDTAGLGAVNGRGTAGLGAVDLATGLKKVSRERACHVSGGEIVGDCFRGSEWHVGGGALTAASTHVINTSTYLENVVGKKGRELVQGLWRSFF